MAIKLNDKESLFRNELIFTVDAKNVNIDSTMVNLFMLLQHNGVRPRQRARAGKKAFIETKALQAVFGKLQDKGEVSGFKEHPEAVEMWLRSNLINMVNIGKHDKEKLSSLRPIHIESYKIRNAATTRDYFTADQVYLMLGANPTVKNDLTAFLMEGWDKTTNKIEVLPNLDVDSLGILNIVKNATVGYLESSSTLNQIQPLLQKQAELYCDDVRRLLVYKTLIPRNVLIDYLKTITSFHLSLYIQKLIHQLPQMLDEGTQNITDDWNIVIDTTDSYDSKVAKIAAEDAAVMHNKLYDYIKSTFQINAGLRGLQLDESNSINFEKVLEAIKKRDSEFESVFKAIWTLKVGEIKEDDDKEMIEELSKYETSYFDKYVELILSIRGKYQYKYHLQLIDSLSQKNKDNGFMAQGRSKKHPRRFVLGTRLLESLVQILVLRADNDKFYTQSLSIEELMQELRNRYGLVINGLSEARFTDSDLNTHLAFKENIEAFKQKLRQIGFYNDLSDAYLLQKIRPRYELNAE